MIEQNLPDSTYRSRRSNSSRTPKHGRKLPEIEFFRYLGLSRMKDGFKKGPRKPTYILDKEHTLNFGRVLTRVHNSKAPR